MRGSLPLSGIVASALMFAACDRAVPAYEKRPIRTVLVGHADIQAIKTFAAISWVTCYGEKGWTPPAAEPAMPSDRFLADFYVYKTEELFNGREWARFETHRFIAADKDRGCQLSVFMQHSGDIEHACTKLIRGSTALLEKLASGEVRADHHIDESDIPCAPEEPPPSQRMSVRNLPRDTQGKVPCTWLSHYVATLPTAPSAGRNKPDDDGADECLYVEMPDYPVGHNTRHVVVRTRIKESSPSPAITWIRETLPVPLATELVEFSDGTPISPDRFTRAALESFLKQPVKQAVPVQQ